MLLKKDLSQVLRTTNKHLKKLGDLGVKRVEDFLLYFPRTYNDSSEYTKIIDLTTTEPHTIKAKVKSLFNMRSKNGKTITKAVLVDDTGFVEAVWFNQAHLTKMLPRDREIVFTGRVKFAMGSSSLQSPSYELVKRNEEQIHSGRIVPTYHETEGISSKWIREKLKPLIDNWADVFKEFLPQTTIDENNLIPYNQAIKAAHFPKDEEELNAAKHRLAFNELFLLQLRVLQKKWYWQSIAKNQSKKIEIKYPEIKKCIDSLSFELTGAQKRVLKEILNDTEKDFPMSRLVQGDVGSGKTIVCALAALNTVMNGYQVALMAPTEILAKQHYKTFMKVLRDFGLNIQFIAGSSSASQKRDAIRQMKTGTVDIIIGTHSLIQEGVSFKNLGLAIIDEQHRFGVEQRETLKKQGTPHLLCTTATPIPRTLAITIYGDQDLSIIDEMPAGRQEILTRLVPETKRQQAYRWIEDQVKKGRQAFTICPLIEESDTLEVKSVTQEYQNLSENIFPDLNVALLHGRMKQEDKDKIMEDFKNNVIQLLVSTSVIEVGIDVPNATIMLIEGAERFGLAQLHQFRGRVGRGEHKSYCFLFTGNLSEEGQVRMKSMEKYSSGFKLSEIDLEIRGPGQIYGFKQSGIPDLKMASLTDSKTVEKARKAAQKIIDVDPRLLKHQQLAEKLAELEKVFIRD